MDTSGPAIGYNPLGIKGAKVSARGDVSRPQFQSQAERLDHPAAHLELQRIVAKQSEMSGSAARRDSGSHGNHPPLGRAFAQRVEIWGCGRLERSEIALIARRHVTHSI